MALRRATITGNGRTIIGKIIKSRHDMQYSYTAILNGAFGGGTAILEYGIPDVVAQGAAQTWTWYQVFGTALTALSFTANTMVNGTLAVGNAMQDSEAILIAVSLSGATAPNIAAILSDSKN